MTSATAELEGTASDTKTANHTINLEAIKKSKHLIFSLSDEKYGMPLSSVREVIGLVDITPIPHVPNFFKGFINLRGKIISVIDLRMKLSLPKASYEAKKTSIIITEIGDLVLGTIVDDVNEVASFDYDQIEKKLDIQSSASRESITGVAKTKDKKLVLLLDIGKALNVDDLTLIRKNTRAASA